MNSDRVFQVNPSVSNRLKQTAASKSRVCCFQQVVSEKLTLVIISRLDRIGLIFKVRQPLSSQVAFNKNK